MKIIIAVILGIFIFCLFIFWTSLVSGRKELLPVQKLMIDLIYQFLGEKRQKVINLTLEKINKKLILFSSLVNNCHIE